MELSTDSQSVAVEAAILAALEHLTCPLHGTSEPDVELVAPRFVEARLTFDCNCQLAAPAWYVALVDAQAQLDN